MRFDRLTTKSREAIQAAQSEASRRGNPELTPEHVILAMLTQEGGVVPALFTKAGSDPKAAAAEFERAVDKLPRVSGGADPGMSRRLNVALQKAEDEAKALKDDYTSVEHVLLAMLKHDRDVAGVLKRFNLDEARFMAALKDVRGNQRVTTADPEGTFQALEKYCRDYTLSLIHI